jgi:hypothetical protein
MVIGRDHLRDDRLVDCYAAKRTGDLPDPHVVGHLEACPACAARYANLSSFMNDLHVEADAEIDELFSDEHLQTVRRQIARRIENLGHIARVISFPGRRSDWRRASVTIEQRSRWIAAAAAAGLLVGVADGAYTAMVADGEPARITISAPTVSAPEVRPSVHEVDVVVPLRVLDEDAFLEELEIAGGGLRARPLMPLDAFTPTVQEISAQLR